MHLDLFQKYLIAINIFSFCLFTVDYVKAIQNGEGIKCWWLCDVVTIIGGSLGALIAFVFWDRKVVKQNITWRVFAVCMLIIHIVLYFLVYRVLSGKIKWEGFNHLLTGIQAFGKTHVWLWYYLLAINLATFIAFAVDKVKAIRDQWRIREVTLLGMSLVGGAIGGLIAMYTMRHKTKVKQFTFGLPMIILTQVIVLAYWVVTTL